MFFSSLKALYKAGEGRLGTDESKFNMILASQSYDQLRAVFEEYHKTSRCSIEQAITKEMSGNLEIGMLTIGKTQKSTWPERPFYKYHIILIWFMLVKVKVFTNTKYKYKYRYFASIFKTNTTS